MLHRNVGMSENLIKLIRNTSGVKERQNNQRWMSGTRNYLKDLVVMTKNKEYELPKYQGRMKIKKK